MAQCEVKNSFCLYLSSFTALNKKGCLHEIQIFFWLFSFSSLLRKVISLSISGLLSAIVNFFNKKRGFQLISPKMLQNNRKAEFSCMWLILRRKTVIVNICPLIQNLAAIIT